MNKRMIMLMAAALALLSARGGVVEFIGAGNHPVIVDTLSDNHTSLSRVFVVYNTDEVQMVYNATSYDPVVWETYENNINDTQEITVRHEGMKTILDEVKPDRGYIITEGGTPTYYWVVNYAAHYLELNDLSYNSTRPCDLVTISVDGHGDAIPYYTINGHRQVLDRDIKLTYYTMEWNDTSYMQEKEKVESFAALDQGVEIAPPLCDTRFVMTGDRFLRKWGLEAYAESPEYYTQAVACGSVPFLEDNATDSISTVIPNTPLSAPVHIVFTGFPTNAVVYRAWEFASDSEFEDVYDRYYQNELDYTFNDKGTYYVRYVVANEDGSCQAFGDAYTIIVAESWLAEPWESPNVFAPGSTVYGVWKMPHKSIAEFHCWIFNRWGNLVYEYTDPDQGWDGTYKGRYVDPGVFYYVIKATGNDGVPWERRGSITTVRSSKTPGTTPSTGTSTGTEGIDSLGY